MADLILLQPNFLEYGFMQRATLAALLVGCAAPLVGVFLVQRRLALIGDGMGHVALAGVAVGVLTGTAPVVTALVAAIACAVVIELIRLRGRTGGDVALALMFYGGIALGVVLMARSSGGTAALTSYLFGAISTTSVSDLIVFAALAAVVVGTTLLLRTRLFAVASDEEYARVAGLPVTALNMLLAILTAVTVVVSMRVVGLLLISALMIVPTAASQLVARSFAGLAALAVLVGVGSSVGGVAASYYLSTPSGGTIVLLAVAVYALLTLVTSVRERIARRSHRYAEPHPHEHGPGCGHPAVVHEDHVDYVHDGHRHAPHGDHYDEHADHDHDRAHDHDHDRAPDHA